MPSGKAFPKVGEGGPPSVVNEDEKKRAKHRLKRLARNIY